MDQGAIYAFINPRQAARFGHVGWGFQLGSGDDFLFGSTDHLWRSPWWDIKAWIEYMSVPPGANVDWWADSGSEQQMLAAMRRGCGRLRYYRYKRLSVASPQPDLARQVAELQAANGWDLRLNNCVHQVFRIFVSYGAASMVPDPLRDPISLIPRAWFARLPAEEEPL